ncbi:hypothetical protein BT96DRAFT_133984 [Gymnopus androsaceus JB14]|uniref:Uncharacterized protein n=1 Tax=Gymnopus androsaceus JB14 TaxID=1447944 RepID=A0A6A4HE13_9AGAR|nr:hypothetical protein BT96DRAFT_133984 [Gymnopus androsaceus JB14]
MKSRRIGRSLLRFVYIQRYNRNLANWSHRESCRLRRTCQQTCSSISLRYHGLKSMSAQAFPFLTTIIVLENRPSRFTCTSYQSNVFSPRIRQ